MVCRREDEDEKSADASPLPLLERNKEVKERKGLKIFTERITLVEDDKIIENDKNTASILNEFFSNIITTLGIPQYNETEPASHNIGNALMKAIMKYRFHPSMVAIKKNCNSGSSFSFSQFERDEIMPEIKNLKTNKATQSTDIPTKLIKENSDIFGDLFWILS